VADGHNFPPITPAIRLHAGFDRVRAIGPSLTERVAGSELLRKRQLLGRRMTWVCSRVQITGLDRIPATGPVILAANHSSFMDGPLLFGFVDRPVSCLVKAEAFAPAGGRAGRILIQGAQIPVLRGEIDRAPIRLGLDLLEAGGVLGIFPEGTRGDGRVDRTMPGVGYFAVRTGAVVVPVAIRGSADMTHRRTVARPRVRMTVGTPLVFERAEAPLHRQDWLGAAERVRVAVADLVRATQFSSNQATAPATPETAKARS